MLLSLNPAYDPIPMVEDVTWCNGLVIGVLDPERKTARNSFFVNQRKK